MEYIVRDQFLPSDFIKLSSRNPAEVDMSRRLHNHQSMHITYAINGYNGDIDCRADSK